MTSVNPAPRGRGWARVGFWTGVFASVAANVAHAFLAGSPSWLMLLFAALPPFALLVGIEVIAQVQWRKVWFQAVIRWGAVGSVAAIGGVVSYDHMRAALLAHGETGVGALLLPILVDGLMTVCSAALLTIGDNTRRAERAAMEAQARAEQEAVRLEAEKEAEDADVYIPTRPDAGWSAETIKEMVTAMTTTDPSITRTVMAKRLGVSTRRLYEILGPVKTSALTSA